MDEQLLEKIEIGEVYLIRLLPDNDIFCQLREICKEKNIKRGVIYSAIGSLKDITFRDVKERANLPIDKEKVNEISSFGPYELLSLEGNVLPMRDDLVIHLHAMIGTPNGDVRGGHLVKAKVFTTLELVIVRIKNTQVHREKSPVTGLNEMEIFGKRS